MKSVPLTVCQGHLEYYFQLFGISTGCPRRAPCVRCHVVILFSPPTPPRMQLLFCGTCVTNCTKMSFLDSGCTNMLHARLQTCYYLDTHCTSSLCSVYYSKPSILFYLQALLLVDCYVQMSPGFSVLGPISLMNTSSLQMNTGSLKIMVCAHRTFLHMYLDGRYKRLK